jgi:pimeloyl-ACP methyl ester carboxylesterase
MLANAGGAGQPLLERARTGAAFVVTACGHCKVWPRITTVPLTAIERFFGQSPQMGATFDLMKSDQDGAQGDGYWRMYVDLAFAWTTTWPGYAFEDLRKIAVPTLGIAGDRDDFCSCEAGVTAYRSLRDGELAILPNTGHVITPLSVSIMQEFFSRRRARSR